MSFVKLFSLGLARWFGLRVVVILRLLFGIQRLLEIVWLFVITLVEVIEVWVAQSFRFEILEGVLGFVVDDLLFMFSSVFLAFWLLILKR